MHSALVALEIVGQLNKTAIDSNSIIKNHGLGESEPSIEKLVNIAKEQSFRARLKSLTPSEIASYPLPCIAQTKEGSYVVVLKIDKEKETMLLFGAGKTEPYVMSYADFSQNMNKRVIILKHRVLNDQIKFGFMWFYVVL
ncbi:cysteine peptidase family C39 domain-containing protein [Sulfurospirillum sp. 1612]|uniref:cysteine peptidase family C39 domain-containing protein n=1 Tax=Sulfurospirillum sp. 1612 TaxID=3094835 RepID=UPI002F950900